MVEVSVFLLKTLDVIDKGVLHFIGNGVLVCAALGVKHSRGIQEAESLRGGLNVGKIADVISCRIRIIEGAASAINTAATYPALAGADLGLPEVGKPGYKLVGVISVVIFESLCYFSTLFAGRACKDCPFFLKKLFVHALAVFKNINRLPFNGANGKRKYIADVIIGNRLKG